VIERDRGILAKQPLSTYPLYSLVDEDA